MGYKFIYKGVEFDFVKVVIIRDMLVLIDKVVI